VPTEQNEEEDDEKEEEQSNKTPFTENPQLADQAGAPGSSRPVRRCFSTRRIHWRSGCGSRRLAGRTRTRTGCRLATCISRLVSHG
jgi:hypothetical protein